MSELALLQMAYSHTLSQWGTLNLTLKADTNANLRGRSTPLGIEGGSPPKLNTGSRLTLLLYVVTGQGTVQRQPLPLPTEQRAWTGQL